MFRLLQRVLRRTNNRPSDACPVTFEEVREQRQCGCVWPDDWDVDPELDRRFAAFVAGDTDRGI